MEYRIKMKTRKSVHKYRREGTQITSPKRYEIIEPFPMTLKRNTLVW